MQENRREIFAVNRGLDMVERVLLLRRQRQMRGFLIGEIAHRLAPDFFHIHLREALFSKGVYGRSRVEFHEVFEFGDRQIVGEKFLQDFQHGGLLRGALFEARQIGVLRLRLGKHDMLHALRARLSGFRGFFDADQAALLKQMQRAVQALLADFFLEVLQRKRGVFAQRFENGALRFARDGRQIILKQGGLRLRQAVGVQADRDRVHRFDARRKRGFYRHAPRAEIIFRDPLRQAQNRLGQNRRGVKHVEQVFKLLALGGIGEPHDIASLIFPPERNQRPLADGDFGAKFFRHAIGVQMRHGERDRHVCIHFRHNCSPQRRREHRE